MYRRIRPVRFPVSLYHAQRYTLHALWNEQYLLYHILRTYVLFFAKNSKLLALSHTRYYNIALQNSPKGMLFF